MFLKGRQEIYTSETSFTRETIPDVINEAIKIHKKNQAECEYLLNYFRGDQPIRHRTKEVREDIMHNTVVNFANYIVRNKVGYFLSSPLQYTLRNSEAQQDFDQFKTLISAKEKPSADYDVAMDAAICGRSFMMAISGVGAEPFGFVPLDPRYTCVVREAKYTHKPVLGFTYYEDQTATETHEIYDVRTAGERFIFRKEGYGDLEPSDLKESSITGLPVIPIVEYRNNRFMLGDFEIVLDLLNDLNVLTSNSLEDIEQLVQSYLVFLNATIDSEVAAKIKRDKMIQLVSPPGSTQAADAKFISLQLNPESVKNLREALIKMLFMITATPERMEYPSGSPTGRGVMLGYGYPAQENDAKGKDMPWYKAERDMIQLMLAILHKRGMCRGLSSEDMTPLFNRTLFETSQANAQTALMMAQGRLWSPEDAVRYASPMVDTEQAIINAKEVYGEDFGIKPTTAGRGEVQVAEI